MSFSLQCYVGPDWDEKPESHGIYDPHNDKVSYGKRDCNHGNQGGNSPRIPKDRGGRRTYSGRESHTSLNKSFRAPRIPKGRRNEKPEKTIFKVKCSEEAEPPQPPEVEITTDEKDEEDRLSETPKDSKPSEKVTVNDNHPDQPITIGGNLSTECRAELIRVLRKHANAFAWVSTDM
ncbi:hypothetical protein Tco_0258396, partial [Tanacetum coccineum]